MVVVGSGMVYMVYGIMFVFVFVMVLLLEGILMMGGGCGEFVMLMGVFIFKEFVDEFGVQFLFVVDVMGYGFGCKYFGDCFNSVCFVWGMLVCELFEDDFFVLIDVLEIQLDDVIGEVVGFFVEMLFVRGVFDVYMILVYMKKFCFGVFVMVFCWFEVMQLLVCQLIEYLIFFGCCIIWFY